MVQLVTQIAAQTPAILYLSLGTEWKTLYRGYFKASTDLNLMTNYLVLPGNDYAADLTLLTNAVIDKHIETVICADEDSYFIAKSLKNVDLKIINVIFDFNDANNYLTQDRAIQINFNWIVTELTTFLNSEIISNEQREIPVKINL
ncbi:hypothetical protein [Spiroplasma endosymbiont of Stenodema calcarata]|uniref:hypothetical protein n=1 Tax=Spiroplasma endosymbiont of Stenodema calcarata TaxID=3139328 RepID=UPI003CCB52D0